VLNVVLWILQGILAVMFLFAGFTKVSQPKEKLVTSLTWVEDFPGRVVKMIGTFEILGAIGLVLPWATGIATVLTPLAALGLVAIMLGAIATHIRRREPQAIVITSGLAIAAFIVAISRF
jgi:uncharacterized membrane protein YphA (DoxX/SURF4 family)